MIARSVAGCHGELGTHSVEWEGQEVVLLDERLLRSANVSLDPADRPATVRA
jgi:hypothetical protein